MRHAIAMFLAFSCKGFAARRVHVDVDRRGRMSDEGKDYKGFELRGQGGWPKFTGNCRIRVWSWALCLLCLATLGPAALSQVTTSSVTGFVADSSGGAAPAATVTIKEVRTGFTRSATTNELGQYSILAIPSGNTTSR